MEHVINAYREAYQAHGKGPSALLCPKGRQDDRFAALTSPIAGAGFSVLDFGCGFADLKKFLDMKFTDCSYTGVDIVQEFILENEKEFGTTAQFQRIDSYFDVKQSYDFIIVSGVFNTLFADNSEQHWQLIQKIIAHLFQQANVALCIDFMTDNVDFVQPGSYHQNPARLYEYAVSRLTRRLVIDCSYLPYEFCVHLYKDQNIVKPTNTYQVSHHG